MDDLAERLHAAVHDPPPTTIDLRQLVARERRRTRMLRRAVLAGVAAGMLAVALAVPVALTGGGLAGLRLHKPFGCPTFGAPDPRPYDRMRPTEPCADAVARLNARLGVVLAQARPDVDWPPASFRFGAASSAYQAMVGVPDGGTVQVDLHPIMGGPMLPESCGQGCPIAIEADGTTLAFGTGPSGGPLVEGHHPDGTLVDVTALRAPSIDYEVLRAIARDRELTLFPDADRNPTATAPNSDRPSSQLAQQLQAGLDAQLVDTSSTDPLEPRFRYEYPSFQRNPEYWYESTVDISDALGLVQLVARFRWTGEDCRTAPLCERDLACPAPVGSTICQVAPDGTKVLTARTEADGLVSVEVTQFRPDGSIAQLTLANHRQDRIRTRPTVPLTTTQLVAVADRLHPRP